MNKNYIADMKILFIALIIIPFLFGCEGGGGSSASLGSVSSLVGGNSLGSSGSDGGSGSSINLVAGLSVEPANGGEESLPLSDETTHCPEPTSLLLLGGGVAALFLKKKYLG